MESFETADPTLNLPLYRHLKSTNSLGSLAYGRPPAKNNLRFAAYKSIITVERIDLPD